MTSGRFFIVFVLFVFGLVINDMPAMAEDNNTNMSKEEQNTLDADSDTFQSKFDEIFLTDEEKKITKAHEVTSQSLFSGKEVSENRSVGIRNVITGVAKFNLIGDRWHHFSFDIYTGFRPNRAVVMLALMNIYNVNVATELNYNLYSYDLSYTDTAVRVTGWIYVGDADGYLRGLSYNCTVY